MKLLYSKFVCDKQVVSEIANPVIEVFEGQCDECKMNINSSGFSNLKTQTQHDEAALSCFIVCCFQQKNSESKVGMFFNSGQRLVSFSSACD